MKTEHNASQLEAIANADAYINNVALPNCSELEQISAELLEALQAINGHDAHMLNPYRVEAARAAIDKARFALGTAPGLNNSGATGGA